MAANSKRTITRLMDSLGKLHTRMDEFRKGMLTAHAWMQLTANEVSRLSRELAELKASLQVPETKAPLDEVLAVAGLPTPAEESEAPNE